MIDHVCSIAYPHFWFFLRLPVPSHDLGELALDAPSVFVLRMHIPRPASGEYIGRWCGVRQFSLTCVLAHHESCDRVTRAAANIWGVTEDGVVRRDDMAFRGHCIHRLTSWRVP